MAEINVTESLKEGYILDYISGLSGKDLGDLYYEKEKISIEIRKYKRKKVCVRI